MKRILTLLIFFIVLSLTAQENWLSYNLDGQVLVEDAGEFSRQITQWTEESGGYYTETSNRLVVLRFPWQQLPQFREWLDQHSREVYRLDQSSQDLRETILSLRSGIEARNELLARNLEYIDRSDFEGTLALEQEVRRVMSELDYRQGQLRRFENDRVMVRAVINISFLSNSLPEKGYSSFPWINSVDAYSFLAGQRPVYRWKSMNFEAPQGFAVEEEGYWWQGVTPEGIRLRLRWVKNYPEMELPFWQDALEAEMVNRGYNPLGEAQELQDSRGRTMALYSWGIPYGQQDYQYLSGILVDGKSILILEMAGPILQVQDYIPALEEAIEGQLR